MLYVRIGLSKDGANNPDHFADSNLKTKIADTLARNHLRSNPAGFHEDAILNFASWAFAVPSLPTTVFLNTRTNRTAGRSGGTLLYLDTGT